MEYALVSVVPTTPMSTLEVAILNGYLAAKSYARDGAPSPSSDSITAFRYLNFPSNVSRFWLNGSTGSVNLMFFVFPVIEERILVRNYK